MPLIVYPDGHAVHADIPVDAAYVLPEHTLHDVAVLSSVPWNVPTAHAGQVMPLTYRPAFAVTDFTVC